MPGIKPSQEKTLSALVKSESWATNWKTHITPATDGQLTACAYNCLGHCWYVWIISVRGKLENGGRPAILPTSITVDLKKEEIQHARL